VTESEISRAADDIEITENSAFKRWWRPAAAWVYLTICAFDFMVAPIFMPWWCFFLGVPVIVWTPITLQGAGLFHLSFGAILGVYAWSRGREKRDIIARAAKGD